MSVPGRNGLVNGLVILIPESEGLLTPPSYRNSPRGLDRRNNTGPLLSFLRGVIPSHPEPAKMNYKPSGYPSISPYLVVDDGQQLIDFLEEVFDGRVARRYERADGSLAHAEVMIDDGVVMVGEATKDWKALRSMIHLYHPDVDAVFVRAVAAGAVVQQEPVIGTAGDTDKRGGFLDPCGNSWWVSTQTD